MKAIIVPGITDLNKGDQALVWESYRLIKDTERFEDIYILSSGDTLEEKKLLTSQSKEQGFTFIENILPHPRRGKHKKDEYIVESKIELLKQIKNAFVDFIKLRTLLLIKSLFIIKKIYNEEIYNTVKLFNEVDVVFVKGGGFIHAYGEKSAPYLIWYLLFYIRLALKFKKKVVILPNSFGPFEGFTVKKQVKSVLKKVDIIYARERISSEQLANLLKREIPVEMDLGFFLEKTGEKEAVRILEKYNLSPEDKIIGITVRPWRFPDSKNSKKKYESYIKSFVDLVKYLITRGYKVAICNQSLGPNEHENDRNAIKDIISCVRHPDVIWIDENLNCVVLKTLYSFFYAFIGTRFHSIIFSLTSYVPSIAVAYGGNKATGIMNDIGLEDFVININDVESQKLIKLFDKLIENRDSIIKRLKEYTAECNESRKRMISEIKNFSFISQQYNND